MSFISCTCPNQTKTGACASQVIYNKRVTFAAKEQVPGLYLLADLLTNFMPKLLEICRILEEICIISG